MWGLVGQLVSQILLQLGSIASASTTSSSTTLRQLDWLGESTEMLLPIIERNAPLSHLIAVVLGLFMSSFVTSMTNSLKRRKIPQFIIVLSLEFYLGTVLWFRFCFAPVVDYLGMTPSRATNIQWMGTLVLGFSHTTAFAFGNFLYQDYYRRGFDKKPEHAFIKYYSLYGSIFVIGRVAAQVLCSMRACSRDGEALLMLAIYFLAFLHVTVENETFHNAVWPIMSMMGFAVFFLDTYLRPLVTTVVSFLLSPMTSSLPLIVVLLLGASLMTMSCYLAGQIASASKNEMQFVPEQVYDQKRRSLEFPPPFPNGWYKLAKSGDVKPGQVISVNGLGRAFAIFRGEEDEQVYILDALCPHLGANIAVGGVVEGSTVTCPFHGWKFNGDGICVDIPYSKSIPSLARTKRWVHREFSGIIVVWYDAEEREPLYEPVSSPVVEGMFRKVGYRTGTLPMHIQDFAENASDWMHFSLLHDRLSVPILDRFFYIRHQTHCDFDSETNPFNFVFHDRPTVHSIFYDEPIKAAEAVAKVEFTGPGGLVYFRFFTKMGQVVIIKSFLPVGEKGLQLTMEDEAYAENSVPYLMALHIIREANKAFDDDIFVWRNKTYKHRPVFTKEDGPVKQFRNYYKRFYSPNSRTYAHDTLDW
ncbi:hypothetical protein DFQ26_002965 [Actinomortierella ambigua]|nr:hypothetical protein DFQ26_002965 [Actinomortierella ambigua]